MSRTRVGLVLLAVLLLVALGAYAEQDQAGAAAGSGVLCSVCHGVLDESGQPVPCPHCNGTGEEPDPHSDTGGGGAD